MPASGVRRGENEMERKRKKRDLGWVGIIFKNVFTYFNAIFAIIAVLLIFVGSYNSLTFLPVVIANALIGIIQQLRARSVLKKLSLLSRSKYKVTRNGSDLELTTDDLQRNDTLLLESGQQIPADAEVIEGEIAANEALLTGETDEIEKKAHSTLMSGSFVVSGRCLARLTHVGEDSYAARLQSKAQELKEKPSEMVHDIDLIVKVAGIAIIPIGLLLFYQAMFINGNPLKASIESMVGAVTGMIPEGLYLLVTIALALSAMRLAKNQVLLHDMRSTETLTRVDVLCVDKTGTITDNAMKVTEIFASGELSPDEMKQAEALLSAYISTITDTNSTMLALRDCFSTVKPWQTQRVLPFSSKNKHSEITDADGVCWRFGAPEFILDSETLSSSREEIEQRTGKGERVLVFARKDKAGTFYPVLFVSLINGLRPNVKETFAWLRDQEVRVVVISGDNPLTVSKIAQQVGIPGAENYINASDIPEGSFDRAVRDYTVFGRVKPEQKKQIVEALRAQKLKVAMTGDGVNDILAMKEADCSIAIGTGSDAARQAAQVVLMDDDFSHMKQIISEGRRDINNITRSATLFLYKNLFSMLLAAFSIMTTFSYPLKPSQVSLVSMFNIGIPAFVLALEANYRKQHGRFLHEALFASVPAAVTSFFTIAARVVFAGVFGITETDVGIASTFLLSAVGFMILWKLCMPMNPYRCFVIVACVCSLILAAYFLADLFAIDFISLKCILLSAVFVLAEESMIRNFTNLTERLRRRKGVQ